MKRFIGISLCVCCCGCASIFSDSEYVQKFEASVPDVVMDIEKNGKSYQEGVPVPGEIKLPADNGYFSRADYSFTFKKEGYKDKVITRRAKVDPFYWVNVATIYAAVIGMVIVDPWTGAMWSLEEAPIVAVMEKTDLDVEASTSSVKQNKVQIESERTLPSEVENGEPIEKNDPAQKCSKCGAVMDANGKCPLCEN